MQELKFWAAMSDISRRGAWVDYFTKVYWLTMLKNFVCDKAYFKLYPVFNLK